MSITDELREWAEEFWEFAYSKFGDKSNLIAIADRIDAAHERKMAEVSSGWDYWESTHVELPKDADGEYIHVGDVMERGNARGHVIALMLSEYPKKWGGGLHWGVQLEWEHAPTALDLTFHHYHEPTVEDVLREFVTEFNRDDTELCDEEIIEQFAAKLRLAESEDA